MISIIEPFSANMEIFCEIYVYIFQEEKTQISKISSYVFPP